MRCPIVKPTAPISDALALVVGKARFLRCNVCICANVAPTLFSMLLFGLTPSANDGVANGGSRSVSTAMLVMWDRGFHDYDMLAGVRSRGAHVLARLPAHVKPQLVQVLPDGTWLAYTHVMRNELNKL